MMSGISIPGARALSAAHKFEALFALQRVIIEVKACRTPSCTFVPRVLGSGLGAVWVRNAWYGTHDSNSSKRHICLLHSYPHCYNAA